MDIFERRPLPGTDLQVTPVGVGTSALGNLPEPAEVVTPTVRRVFDSGLNVLDTSAGYGESERRIGATIAAAGGLPDGFILSSKADPDPVTKDFSGARVRRSFEESLERLGVDRLPLYFLHDPERITFAEATRPGGPVEVMAALREEGLVDHIGVAGGPIDLMCDYVAAGVFQVVLTHSRYNLLDRSAEPLLAAAAERGVGVVNAAPFGGGLLAKGPAGSPRFAYRPATAATLAAATEMERACAAAGIPLAAAALQFSMREPRIALTVLGVSSPARVDEAIALATTDIPEDLWSTLDSHLPR